MIKTTLLFLLCAGTFLLAFGEQIDGSGNKTLDPQKKIEILQRQLDEWTRAWSESEARLREYQLALGNMLDEEKISSPERKEEQLLQLLSGISEQGGTFAGEVRSFAREMLEMAKQLPPDAESTVKLRLRAQELEEKAANFGAMLKRSNAGDRSDCRVLAFDRQEGIAVISAGSVNGIFPGTVYKVKDRDIFLRVISCRGFVSGALVVKGDMNLLTPGQECHLIVEQHGDGRIMP